jgi:uncharacterized membrane protein YqjE
MGILCDTFTKTFFETIDPKSHYSRLLSLDVFISLALHVFLYLFTLCSIICLLNLKVDKNIYYKIFMFLVIIMPLGYLWRLSRSKSIYNYLISTGKNQEKSREEAMRLMEIGYFRFYFLA